MTDVPEIPNFDQYLTPEERSTLQRLLSAPEEFPREFGSWISAYLAVNGELDKRQINGVSNFSVYPADEVVDEDSVSSTSFGDLSHVGPSLTGLKNGLYIVQFGGLARAGDADGSYAIETISVNGTVTSDEIWAGANFSSVSKTAHVALTQGNNNSIVAKYRRFGGAAAVTWRQRWMVAIRYGTL